MTSIHSEYSTFKGRGSLQQVVEELKQQIDARNDFVIDSRDLTVGVGDAGELLLVPSESGRDFLPREGVGIMPQALVQIGSKATPKRAGEKNGVVPGGVPGKFLRNVATYNPTATAEFLSALLRDDPKRRMCRVLYGNLRAFLSDKFRAIDNYDCASHALKTLKDCGGRVIEASLSDTHMRIKMISEEIWSVIERKRTSTPSSEWYAGGLGNQEFLSRVAARSVGNLKMEGGPDTVMPIGTLGNSETGHGGLFYRGGILQGICFNLATVEEVMRAVHLGSRQEVGIYTDETLRKEAEAIFSKLADTVTAFFTQETFEALVAQCRESASTDLKSPSGAVGLLVQTSDVIDDRDMNALIDHLTAQPVDIPTVYDLGQAVARLAQDTDDSTIADDIERLAGEVLIGKHNNALQEELV